MSKKPAEVDHAAALLLTLARAVERMTRMGSAKEFHADIASGIAAVEAANADSK